MHGSLRGRGAHSFAACEDRLCCLKNRFVLASAAMTKIDTNPRTGAACWTCALPYKIGKELTAKIASEPSLKAVHRWLVKTYPKEAGRIGYAALAQHYRLHVNIQNRAIRKLSDHERAIKERIKLSNAVLKGEAVDPVVFFSPSEIARDVSKTVVRLDVAATESLVDNDRQSLAQLSNSLLRAHELRGKLGGAIKSDQDINISVAVGQVTARLDAVLSDPAVNRAAAARQLLALPEPPTSDPAQTFQVSAFDSSIIDAEPVTVSAEPIQPEPMQPESIQPAQPKDEPGPSAGAAVNRR